jgi:hypothetical protein
LYQNLELLEDSKIAILEAQRISLMHKFTQLNALDLTEPITEGKWSIIQLVEHIVLSEELSVSYVLNKVQKPELLTSVSLKSKVYLVLMGLVLKLNIKYKAPKVVTPESSVTISLTELSARWEKVRMDLELLSKLSPAILKKGILKHPRLGFLSFSQMLDFFSTHYAHHLEQINNQVEHKISQG